MKNKDNVISIEDYKKSLEPARRKAAQAVQSAPHPTPEQMRRMIEASPPPRRRVQVTPAPPKPWYHWYKEQR
jgi:hypothetical protein